MKNENRNEDDRRREDNRIKKFSAILMIIIGILFAIPIIMFLVKDFSFKNTLDSLFMILLSGVFGIGGIWKFKRL